jgi:hypothetical protein
MRSLWPFLSDSKNQKTLAWLGSGLVVAAGGTWAVVTYVWPMHDVSPEPSNVVCARLGSIAAGHDASGDVINYNGGAPMGPGGPPESCGDLTKPH